MSQQQVREGAYAVTKAGPFVSRLQCDCHRVNPDACVAPNATTMPFQTSALSKLIMDKSYEDSPGSLSALAGYLRLRAAPSVSQ
jgi:hypothetical protein